MLGCLLLQDIQFIQLICHQLLNLVKLLVADAQQGYAVILAVSVLDAVIALTVLKCLLSAKELHRFKVLRPIILYQQHRTLTSDVQYC